MNAAELIEVLRQVPGETPVIIAGEVYSDVGDISVQSFSARHKQTDPLLPWMQPIAYREWSPDPLGSLTVVLS